MRMTLMKIYDNIFEISHGEGHVDGVRGEDKRTVGDLFRKIKWR